MSDTTYRLATYVDANDAPRAGIIVDDWMIDVTDALQKTGGGPLAALGTSVLGVLRRWRDMHPRLQAIAASARRGEGRAATAPLSAAQLLAPVMYPGTVFCAGANYRDHVQEMSRALNLPVEPDPHELGLNPWHFIKASVPCVRGNGARVALPAYSKCVDWEAEIAVVIGRECRNVRIDDALEYVAGVSIVNDLSARDHLRRESVAPDSPFRFDWVSQKSFDGALPFGPWIVPLDQIQDVGNLRIRLWVNEELMQDSSSSNLIFSVAEQIAHLSSRLTLQPGDVIATGTPAGCGAARGRFLKPGDRVSIWVQDIGVLITEFTT
jgi:2-keto-4-pentenoate hydratase/2-oxohepta-3-ene-1,7-dioic acid hydratase in catechol pathway